MLELQVSVSDALLTPRLPELRALLDAAFASEFSDDDWAHALGGLHVWATGPDGIVSHGSLVERTLVLAGQTLRVGYVEAVATAPAQQGKGYGTLIMKRIGELVRERYALGALSTGSHAFYEALGWERWRGTTFVNGPRGSQRTPDDDGGVMILRTPGSPDLDLDGNIVCDWRPGDVW